MEHKEAIEIVKKNYPHVGFSGSQFETALRVLVPELAESDDDKIRKAIGAAICGTTAISILEANGTNLSDALSYLEKQKEKVVKFDHDKEQQPAEWSEEDEKMLTGIIERGSSQVPPYEPVLREEQMEWLMNRLKSIRPQPHWKPSKEQMRCLLDCVSKAKEIHNASVGGYDAYRILVSLYDELHKL